jgi:hypothetical protein
LTAPNRGGQVKVRCVGKVPILRDVRSRPNSSFQTVVTALTNPSSCPARHLADPIGILPRSFDKFDTYYPYFTTVVFDNRDTRGAMTGHVWHIPFIVRLRSSDIQKQHRLRSVCLLTGFGLHLKALPLRVDTSLMLPRPRRWERKGSVELQCNLTELAFRPSLRSRLPQPSMTV